MCLCVQVCTNIFDDCHRYGEETPSNLCGKLNHSCRTPGKVSEQKLAVYRDYLYHLEQATVSLPNYRGKVCDTYSVAHATTHTRE